MPYHDSAAQRLLVPGGAGRPAAGSSVMARPSYQFYPGDWRRDTALQACSIAARGLWIEMMNVMHDGEPYGHLTAGGVPISDQELARMVGVPLRELVVH